MIELQLLLLKNYAPMNLTRNYIGKYSRGLHSNVITIIIALIGIIPQTCLAATWLSIDTNKAVVSVMQANKTILKLEDISVGRGGVGNLHLKGDNTTPLGEFRITRINHKSQFRRFFEINYPTLSHALAALQQNLIDQSDYKHIFNTYKTIGRSPYDTPLGGYLGIHGLGDGDLDIHRAFNWTNGCIALDNQQIDILAQWIKVGTKVIIK